MLLVSSATIDVELRLCSTEYVFLVLVFSLTRKGEGSMSRFSKGWLNESDGSGSNSERPGDFVVAVDDGLWRCKDGAPFMMATIAISLNAASY